MGDQWVSFGEGTWSVNGDNLTITMGGEVLTGKYGVSGNTLTITADGETETLTKTEGVVLNGGDGGNGGAGLALGDGQAWTTIMNVDGSNMDLGFVFKQDGIFLEIFKLSGEWFIAYEGDWHTEGNMLHCSLFDAEGLLPYAVSGNTLTIPGITLTKTDNVYPRSLAKKVNAKTLTDSVVGKLAKSKLVVGGSFMKKI
jgi:hypothetical protein